MPSISRRGFLIGSLAALAAGALPNNRAEAGLVDRLLARSGRETTPITPNDEFYVTSIGPPPDVRLDRWSLRIAGLVRTPLTLTYDDLLKRRQTSLISTLECIGNDIGGPSIGTARWEGVRLNILLDEAGVKLGAMDLVMRGQDDYSDSVLVARAMRDEVLLATKMNGVPLPPEHGFPARVIVPGIYGMKNVKWLGELELVAGDYQGYWQQQGWSDDAVIPVRSRIDRPGRFDILKPGIHTVKGIAFGGLHGIAKVEVSADGGASWRAAALEPPLSPYAWVLWTYRWEVRTEGDYALMVRATDTRGVVQDPEPRVSFPDGDSGLHRVPVTVKDV